MPKFDFVMQHEIQPTSRIRQLEAMFEVPPEDKTKVHLSGELPFDEFEWQIGAILGPSGCGKSSILRHLFGERPGLSWNKNYSVIDDFDTEAPIEEIVNVLSAVGFNTIPAWMRPYDVLSTGEKFRAYVSRLLLGPDDPITIDEFTSVVDRQVAKVASYAIARAVRKGSKRMVVASCHDDIMEWLQPDWVFYPHLNLFHRRELRRRPPIGINITRVGRGAWQMFAPFHYMSSELSTAAKCYGLFADLNHTVNVNLPLGNLAAFAGILHFPHPKVKDIMRVSRVVTLPDWQGLGLAMCLLDKLGAAYSSLGKRFRNYPGHPSFIRTHMKSQNWKMMKEAGAFSPRQGDSGSMSGFGSRACAVFEYVGPHMHPDSARKLIQ